MATKRKSGRFKTVSPYNGLHFALPLVGLIVGIAGAANDAQAQTVPPSVDREQARILEQQQQQADERARQFEELVNPPPSGIELPKPQQAEPEQGKECATVNDVRIEGMTIYSRRDFAESLSSVTGNCVYVADIEKVIRSITNRYVAGGYVTSRAFVRPQDLKDGSLIITVMEGQVEAVRPDGKEPYGKRETGAAFAGVNPKILNLRALEQGVDQLARMAKAEPTIDITPGANLGSSIVLVKRKPAGRWFRPNLSLSNQGPSTTGHIQTNLGLDAESLLGAADVWSFYLQPDLSSDPNRGSNAYGGFVSIPYGWWTASFSLGRSSYHSLLEGNGVSFASRGQSWNAGGDLSRMVYRDAKTKLSLTAGISLLDTKNYIQGILLQTGSYRIVSGNFGGLWQRKAGNSLLSVRAGFEQGLGILGAHTVDTGPGGPTGKYSLISGDFTVQTQWKYGGTNFTNLALLRGQLGLTNLFPSQRFSLGGPSNVRGFRDDGISGRSGFNFREQLGIGLFDLAKKSGFKTAVSAFTGFDLGKIAPNSYDAYERGTLSSATVGIKAQGKYAQAELSFSHTLSSPSWVRSGGTEVMASIRMTL